MRTLLPVLVSVLLVTVSSGCNYAGHLPPATSLTQAPETVYRIQVGDLLGIKFFFNADMDEDVLVRSDGRVSLPIVADVAAAGLTPAELVSELELLFSAELESPEIAVIVRESAKRIYVYGEVGKPGEIEWVRPLSALDAVASVGGFTDRARMNQVVLVRRADDGTAAATVIDADRARTDPTEDVQLEPYDLVYVPRSSIGNVNVWVEQYIRNNLPIPVRAGF